MEEWDSEKEELKEGFVEAIEDGQIVVVEGDYARQEGLVVLRRGEKANIDREDTADTAEQSSAVPKTSENREEVSGEKKPERKMLFDDYRKPLDWKKKQVIRSLIDNFHWELMRARRDKGLSRKQVAKALNIEEDDVKLAENGMIEEGDFVLVNKLQEYYNINLRKDRKDFGQPMRALLEEEIEKNSEDTADRKSAVPKTSENQREVSGEKKKKDVNVLGDEIELIGD